MKPPNVCRDCGCSLDEGEGLFCDECKSARKLEPPKDTDPNKGRWAGGYDAAREMYKEYGIEKLMAVAARLAPAVDEARTIAIQEGHTGAYIYGVGKQIAIEELLAEKRRVANEEAVEQMHL